MITTEGLLQAYYDCRRNKRHTASAITYEMDYESKLIALRDRVNTHTYQPGKSICFVVTRPRYREVFAASFEDRIIHHYIALRLEPLFERAFCDRTFNCRKEKGQLYGLNVLTADVRAASENYTRDCYIMKLDLSGFFMSIDKKLLARKIDQFIIDNYTGGDKEDLRELCRIVVTHRPELNCERHSPAEFWDHLPPNKSLFTNGEGKGVAIGNLFAQLFANFLLNDLDWYLEELGIKYHGRYVDDFYCIHTDKDLLLRAVPLIRAKLAELGLCLNEKKFYLQHYTKGVAFTGSVVKPGRVYTANRSINNFISAVMQFNKSRTVREVRHGVCRINSYLGLLRHTNEYAARRRILNQINPQMYQYVFIKGRYEILALRNKYKTRRQTLKRIRDGDY